jgi:hypothetical protein
MKREGEGRDYTIMEEEKIKLKNRRKWTRNKRKVRQA